MSTQTFDGQLVKIRSLIHKYLIGLLLQDELADALLYEVVALLKIVEVGPK